MRTERDDAGRAGKKAAHSREDERKKREKEGAMVLYWNAFLSFSKFIGKYDCHYIKCADNLMLQDKESALCISPRMFVTFASK